MVGETVYVELTITGPEACPMTAVSESGAALTRVARTSTPDGDGRITEEVSVKRWPAGTDLAADVDAHVALTTVDESNDVLRLRRPIGGECPCERIEHHDYPVRDVQAVDGTLSLGFYAEDLTAVREIVADVRGVCGSVHLEGLCRTGDDSSSCDPVYVDRDRFTDRQREVLRTAYEMGYFAYPKRANAGEVADALGITTATFVEHLSAAQTKLLDCLLSDEGR